MSFIVDIPAIGNSALSDIGKIADNFEALRCNEIGTAEPSNVAQGMWWLDTTNNILKLCLSTGPNVWLSVMDFSAAGCVKAHIADTVSDSNTVHGVKFGHGNNIDADTVDDFEASEILGSISSGIYSIGDGSNTDLNLVNSDDMVSLHDTGMTLMKEITLNYVPYASMYVYFEMRLERNDWVKGQIYVDGSPAGTLRMTSSQTFVGYTELINGLSDGCKVQLYFQHAGSNALDWGELQNFRILCIPINYVSQDHNYYYY